MLSSSCALQEVSVLWLYKRASAAADCRLALSIPMEEESLFYPANLETSSIVETQPSVEQDAELLPPACQPFISEYGNDFSALQESIEYEVAAGCKINDKEISAGTCSTKRLEDYQEPTLKDKKTSAGTCSIERLGDYEEQTLGDKKTSAGTCSNDRLNDIKEQTQ